MLMLSKKGSLNAFMALYLAYLEGKKNLSQSDLCTYTGLSVGTIRAAVTQLSALGIIEQVGRYSWALGDVCLGPASENGAKPLIGIGPLIPADSSQNLTPKSGEHHKRPAPLREPVNILAGDGASTPGPESEDVRRAGVLSACIKYGIEEPTRSKLSGMKHVTKELIEGHVKDLGIEQIRLVIYRVEHKWKVGTPPPGEKAKKEGEREIDRLIREAEEKEAASKPDRSQNLTAIRPGRSQNMTPEKSGRSQILTAGADSSQTFAPNPPSIVKNLGGSSSGDHACMHVIDSLIDSKEINESMNEATPLLSRVEPAKKHEPKTRVTEQEEITAILKEFYVPYPEKWAGDFVGLHSPEEVRTELTNGFDNLPFTLQKLSRGRLSRLYPSGHA